MKPGLSAACEKIMPLDPDRLIAPIRAVICINGVFIWGEGDLLCLNRCNHIRIPGRERIISLHPGSDNESFYIVTEFNLFYADSVSIETAKITKLQNFTRSRILAVLDEGSNVWVVNAHGTVNYFNKCNSSYFKFIRRVGLNDFSAVFYSASIKRRDSGTLEITFGTIFSGLSVCQVDDNFHKIECPILIVQTLSGGHTGTVFGVKYHQKRDDLLVSCSDDRSVIIWKRNTEGSFELFKKCLGHGARVWYIDVSDNFIASASEDNTCRIWNIDGDLIRAIESDPHSKSIWSVAIDESNKKVAVASNSSSLVIYPFDPPSKCILENFELPAEEFGIIKNIVSAHDGRCFAATSKDLLVEISAGGCVKVIAEVKGISKFPAMADGYGDVYIADDYGSLFVVHSLELSSEVSKVFSIDSGSKILKIFTCSQWILVEIASGGYFLYHPSYSGLYNLVKDPQIKVTSFFACDTRICIGTRQGMLFIYNHSTKQLMDVITITENESIKSIDRARLEGVISCLDRSGNQVYVNLVSRQIILRKRLCKGGLEGKTDCSSYYSFHDQYLTIFSKHIGPLDKIKCGGGHRLWSFNSNDQKFCFSFMSNGKLSIHQGSLDEIDFLSLGSHGKEIRCSNYVDANKSILAGSEDGYLARYWHGRVCDSLRLLNTSIKCINSVRDFVFVSGSNESIDVFMSRDGAFSINYLTSCPKYIIGLETRVLSICARFKNEVCIQVLAGYSDASIRLLNYNIQENNFDLKISIQNVHHNRCVQHLKFIKDDMFVSFGADGYIRTWRIKEASIEPISYLKIHESGINSFDIWSEKCSEKLLSYYKVFTGGEDGSVTVTKIFEDGTISMASSKLVHNSAVTGIISINDHRFISASIDRNIFEHNLDQSCQIRTVFLNRSVISDISSISFSDDALSVYGAGWEYFKYH